MEKWFDEKFERRSLRRQINKNSDFFVRRRLSITNWLIIINIVIYLLIIILGIFGFSGDYLLSVFALQANAFFSGSIWQLLTSMFSHFWLPHLFFNIISLFFIGNFLERIIGRKKFLWFYLISGLFAGLFYSILSFYFGTTDLGAKIFINPNTYSVGASGAIFGLAGLLAILTPFMKVYLIIGPIVALILQSIIRLFVSGPILTLIDFLIMVYIFISIFSIFSFNPIIRKIAIPLKMSFWVLPIIAIVPLIIIGLFIQLPIGNTAHLGGLIAGFIYGYFLKIKFRKKVILLNNYFRQ